MPDEPLTPASAIRAALLRVARNVCKHVCQRDGWSEDDACFEVDLRAAEAELLAVYEAQAAELARLRGEIYGTDSLSADPRKWGLTAMVDGLGEQLKLRDAELARLRAALAAADGLREVAERAGMALEILVDEDAARALKRDIPAALAAYAAAREKGGA